MLFLLLLISFSIVFLIKLVGIILVIAMLSIPASIASMMSYDMRKIMLFSTILSLVFILFGLLVSGIWNTPAGPTIVTFAGLVFIISVVPQKIAKSIRKRI